MKRLISIFVLCPYLMFASELEVMAKIFLLEIKLYEEIIRLEEASDHGTEYHEKIGQLRGMSECMWILLKD